MTGRKRASLTLLLLASAAAHALVLYDHPFEDAYISFRYVRNLLAGHGLVYNPGERVEGFTSFGWVMLLAGVAKLGLDVPAAARALSLGFGIGLVALTGWIASAVQPGSRPWWLASAGLVAAHGTFAYYAATGMETTLFAFLVLAAVVVATTPGRARALWAGAVFVLSALVRPEGAGYAALAAAVLLASRETRRDGKILAGTFALGFLPYFAWRWQHFGWPLPNTYYAKASPSRALFVDGLEHLEEFLTLGAFALAVVGALLVLATRGRARFRRLAGAMIAGAMVNVVLVGGDSFAFFRFLLPAIPFGAIATVEGARILGMRLGANGAKGRVLGAVLWAALATWLVASAFVPRRSLTGDHGISQRRRVLGVAAINADYFVVGRWLRDHFEPGTTIAVNAAGIVPYESELAAIDMLGLNDVHIAHQPIPLGERGAAGHEKHDADYVLDRRPDVIVVGLPVLASNKLGRDTLLPWFRRWFPFLPGDRELFTRPRFAAEYDAVSVAVDARGYFTFFLRKGAARPKRRR
jgi:hypothetical protein